MANNINVRDATGNVVTLKTTDSAGVHTPTQNVVGPLTDAQLRATGVPVTGPVTDTQLRASPVPVSGPVTDTQLRASAVPVSLPAGALNVSVSATPLYVPISTGVFNLAPSATILINIPGGSVGVRFYAQDCDVLYRFGASAPAVPAVNTLGSGGVAKKGFVREQLIPVGPTQITLASSEISFAVNDLTSASIDVEFFGT